MRKTWTEEELTFLAAHPTDWEGFHAVFPERSYDAWEVKRRRMPGASAGLGRLSTRSAKYALADDLAEQVLRVVENYVRERSEYMDESVEEREYRRKVTDYTRRGYLARLNKDTDRQMEGIA